MVHFRLEEEFGRSKPLGYEEALRAALLDSVRHYLVADAPVGALLSGGVDSSALVGLVSELHRGTIRTVTLAVDDPALDGSPLARIAAAQSRTNHLEAFLHASTSHAG